MAPALPQLALAAVAASNTLTFAPSTLIVADNTVCDFEAPISTSTPAIGSGYPSSSSSGPSTPNDLRGPVIIGIVLGSIWGFILLACIVRSCIFGLSAPPGHRDILFRYVPSKGEERRRRRRRVRGMETPDLERRLAGLRGLEREKERERERRRRRIREGRVDVVDVDERRREKRAEVVDVEEGRQREREETEGDVRVTIERSRTRTLEVEEESSRSSCSTCDSGSDDGSTVQLRVIRPRPRVVTASSPAGPRRPRPVYKGFGEFGGVRKGGRTYYVGHG